MKSIVEENSVELGNLEKSLNTFEQDEMNNLNTLVEEIKNDTKLKDKFVKFIEYGERRKLEDKLFSLGAWMDLLIFGVVFGGGSFVSYFDKSSSAYGQSFPLIMGGITTLLAIPGAYFICRDAYLNNKMRKIAGEHYEIFDRTYGVIKEKSNKLNISPKKLFYGD